MESILCVDILVQMISCTDTNGKITPMRFRFRDKTGKLITVTIEKVLSEEQYKNKVGASFSCTAMVCGTRKTFTLWYNYHAHEWHVCGSDREYPHIYWNTLQNWRTVKTFYLPVT